MSLQELFRSRGTHLRRYDTEKIILDTDHIYRSKLILIDNDLQCSGKFLVFLSLPMEIHTDSHSVKDKRWFGKHR